MRYSLLSILLLCFSCVEPFKVDVPNNGELLVVEGNVSNKKNSSFIRLTRSTSFGVISISAVKKATVFVEDQNGTVEKFVEGPNDEYIPEDTTFLAVLGNSYKLKIRLNDLTEYESSWVEVLKTPEIDSVYYEVEERETSNVNLNVRGVQFYLDTKDPTNNTRFYRWRMIETWSYGVRYPAVFNYIGNDMVERKPKEDIGDFCYKSVLTPSINVATSRQLIDDVISNRPLLFVPEESGKFNETYSLLVEQSAISKDEFLFLNELNRSGKNNGSFHDKQPDPVVGNIRNTANQEENVLGYFSASSVTEKRIFVKGRDLGLRFYEPVCLLDTVPEILPPGGGSIFFELYYNMGVLEGYLYVSLPCGDCRSLGGTITKPDFWED